MLFYLWRKPVSSYKILPFQFKHIFDDVVLLVNECGDFIFLKSDIFDKFIRHILSNQDENFLRLKSHLFVAQDEIESSLQKISARYRTKKSFLRDFTTLHMMVITLRCNQRCEYCQVSCAEEDAQNYDMKTDVARRIVDTIFSAPTKNPKIEFQGGEPLLNWPVIKDVVAAATVDKPVRIGEVNQDATALNIQQRGLGFIDEMIKLCTADGKKVAVVGNEFYVNNCSDKGDEKTAEVIIEVGVPAQTTVDLATTEANKIMSKADTIAIFGSNQTTAEGVITANETLNKLATDPAAGIIGAGFDAGTPQKAAIKGGKLIGSVTQSPLMMGYKTIYTLVDVCNGKTVEDIPMDGYWYNADNMEDENIAPNLYD